MPLKEVGNLKAKKSPSGWRSIFSKGNRQSSIKHKNHKSGLSRKKDLLNFIPISIINMTFFFFLDFLQFTFLKNHSSIGIFSLIYSV